MAPNKAMRALKIVYQVLRYPAGSPKSVALILGMQRSGTTMLADLFRRDWNAWSFGEDGGLAKRIGYEPLLLKSPSEVAQIIGSRRAPLVVAKPIVESHNAEKLLEAIPLAKIVWPYRHYRDVARSNKKKFPRQPIFKNLDALVNKGSHWYSDNVSDETRAIVAERYDRSMPPLDAWALGWYVRNAFVFRYKHLPIILVKYEDLVRAPAQEMRRIYSFLEVSYPGDYVTSHIHAHSVGLGSQIKMGGKIEEICEEMQERLDALRLGN